MGGGADDDSALPSFLFLLKYPFHSHARATLTFFLKENAAPASLLRKADAAEMA